MIQYLYIFLNDHHKSPANIINMHSYKIFYDTYF